MYRVMERNMKNKHYTLKHRNFLHIKQDMIDRYLNRSYLAHKNI